MPMQQCPQFLGKEGSTGEMNNLVGETTTSTGSPLAIDAQAWSFTRKHSFSFAVAVDPGSPTFPQRRPASASVKSPSPTPAASIAATTRERR